MKRLSSPASLQGRRLSIEQLEPRALLAATDLRITEFLASNDDGLLDAGGDASDWIEIYNSGPTSVSLAGMHLTDNASNKTKWTFPAGTTLEAGAYRVVFASDKDGTLAGDELHTNFKLSADGEYLGLIAVDGVTVIDQYTPKFPAQIEDISYGRAMQATGSNTTIIATGATARAWVPTSSVYDTTWRNPGFNDALFNIAGPTGFGYENNPGDATNYTAEIGTTVPNTTLSLYMRLPFNLPTLAGVDKLTLRMRYDDGFVAYLNGEPIAEANAPETVQWNSQAASSRSDSLAEQFVEFDVSAFISRLKVGANVLAVHGLNQSGSDMLISPELTAQSKTLVSPERIGYFDVPTPGYGNGSNYLGFTNSPIINAPHGFYTTTQSVSISAPDPGSIIVYTTNGSTPTVNASLVPTNGTLYTGPINVSATTVLRAVAFKLDYKPSFVSTSSYLFLNDVINQSPTGTPPAGWPANGAVNGQQINYGIDPDIINLYGAEAVKSSLASLPSFSITTDLPNLFDATTGIYVNALNDGREWERPASVELINSNNSGGFTINAGLRIRGGYSRNDFNPKHAFRLYFRGEYGAGKLEYPLFGPGENDEFDVIDLRTEQNYSWSSTGNVQNTFLREVFSRDLQADLGDQYTRSNYYHMYVDGQYFGVFQTQERIEESFGATYFGGAEEDYDIVKAGLNDGGGTQVAEGNDAAWQQLFALAQNFANNPAANANNYWTMQGLNPDGTRNPSLPVLLDVDNLVNYMLIIFYTGGYDTALSRFLGDNQANNWYGVYNRVAADQGFQFFLHDNEHALGAEDNTVHGTQNIDRTGPFNNGNQSNYAYFNPVYLHQDLLSSALYRNRIIEKAQEYFFNNGPMTPAASIARMTERKLQVDPAIIAEAARWGDSKVSTPRNKTTWQNEVDWLLNVYFPGRTATVIEQLRADGLYVTPPAFSLPGGVVAGGAMLTMTAPGNLSGAIFYTTDGVSDPRLPNGNLNNGSGQLKAYSSPIAINADQTIKARYRTTAGNWSVLMTVTYDAEFAADYDGDERVTGDDFLVWQQQLGRTDLPVGSGADGVPDGVIDGADLNLWMSGFGGGGQVTVAVAAAAAFALSESAFFGASLESSAALSTAAVGDSVAAAKSADEVFSTGSFWARGVDLFLPAVRRSSFRPAGGSLLDDDEAGADSRELLETLNAAWAEIL